MSPVEAEGVLRDANYAPGVVTSTHPRRAEIKQALHVLRAAGIDVQRLGLVHVPPPPPAPLDDIPPAWAPAETLPPEVP